MILLSALTAKIYCSLEFRGTNERDCCNCECSEECSEFFIPDTSTVELEAGAVKLEERGTVARL